MEGLSLRSRLACFASIQLIQQLESSVGDLWAIGMKFFIYYPFLDIHQENHF